MKTDLDLFEEFLRYFFTSNGGSAAQVELQMIEFRKRFKTNKPKPLSDEEYSTQLAQMKKEGPAFLHHLMTSSFPSLPPEFLPKNN